MKSFEEFLAKRAEAKARKAKRAEKRKELKIGDSTPKGVMKSRIVRILGLLDAKINGKACRIHGAPCAGEVAYHLIPQQRGDAARFIRENVVWACRRANFGERMNRSLYRERHIQIFGRELIERLEEKAKEIVQISRAELREIFDRLKEELGTAPGLDRE